MVFHQLLWEEKNIKSLISNPTVSPILKSRKEVPLLLKQIKLISLVFIKLPKIIYMNKKRTSVRFWYVHHEHNNNNIMIIELIYTLFVCMRMSISMIIITFYISLMLTTMINSIFMIFICS